MFPSLRFEFWWPLCLGLLACTERVHEVGVRHPSAEDGGAQLPWGRWAAELAVPACPPMGAVLTVDTLAEELEGGAGIGDRAVAGEHLSLTEALWIAHNRPGPDTILFDAQVFPVETPGTIVLEGLFAMPRSVSEVCIDARNRGVIVYWAPAARTGVQDRDETFLWGIGSGSLQVGLELRAIEVGLRVAGRGQLAGCRFFVEPGDFQRPLPGTARMVELSGGEVGPGNVFFVGTIAVFGVGSIRGNFMGFDPRNGQNVPVHAGMSVYGLTVVEENVISSVSTAMTISGGQLTFRNNWVGLVPETRAPLEAPDIALRLFWIAGSAYIGPGNQIRADSIGVETHVNNSSTAIATVTQSTFVTRVPISFVAGSAPLAPPEITSAEANRVTGTCPAAGRVEVFSGTMGNPEQYQGAADCPGPGPWTATPLAVPPGHEVRATLTNPSGHTSAFSAPFLVR